MVRLIQEALDFSNLLPSIILHLLILIHPQKDSRKATWHSPNGHTHNQIDFILTPQRFKSSIHKSSTRSYPGAVINSDQYLVICNMRLKLRSQNMKKSNRIWFDLEKLKNTHTSNEYKDELEAKLKNINIDELSTDKLIYKSQSQ